MKIYYIRDDDISVSVPRDPNDAEYVLREEFELGYDNGALVCEGHFPLYASGQDNIDEFIMEARRRIDSLDEPLPPLPLPPLPLPGAVKQKVRKPRESLIEGKVRRYAKARGLRADKFTSPNRRSVPDRIFLGPGALIFFIEFKRPGEKPTKLQEAEHAELRAMGFDVYVIDNVDEGKRLIDRYADA